MSRRREHHPTKARSEAAVRRAVDTLLEGIIQPIRLEPREMVSRLHDDNDGRPEQTISVGLGTDGDVWLLAGARQLRFRTYAGGGRSPRVRNALLLLAEAIRRDEDLDPLAR